MPQLGDTTHAKDIGLKGTRGMAKYGWTECNICHQPRWVLLRSGKPVSNRCHSCYQKQKFGANHPRWNGGRVLKNGYYYQKVYKDDFYYPMANQCGYALEHRLIIAQSLDRCLLPWEIVHHINGDKGDNRLENLKLFPSSKGHLWDTVARKHIKYLEQQLVEYIELKQKAKELGGKIAIIRDSCPLAEQNYQHPSVVHTKRNLKPVIWEADND